MAPKKTTKKNEEGSVVNEADVHNVTGLDKTSAENGDSQRNLTKAELFYLRNSQDTDSTKAEELGVSLDVVVSNKTSPVQNTNLMVRDPKKGFAVMTRAAAERVNPQKGKKAYGNRGHIHNPLKKAGD